MQKYAFKGSGCGWDGRADTSYTSSLRFESSLWELFYNEQAYCWKDNNKDKRGQEWAILKRYGPVKTWESQNKHLSRSHLST